MENQNETFTYTYSAKEQAEVEHIRDKYLPREEDKMTQLRKLDQIPGKKAQSCAISIGTVGTLTLGLGMSLAMTDLGTVMGSLSMAAGVVIGVTGMVLVALAYPVYNRVLKRERGRIAPEILRLTEELLH